MPYKHSTEFLPIILKVSGKTRKITNIQDYCEQSENVNKKNKAKQKVNLINNIHNTNITINAIM